MLVRKLTAALLLLAVAASTVLAAPAAHVHIHIKSAPTDATTTTAPFALLNTTTTTTSANSPFGVIDTIDVEHYKLAACAPQVWNISRANATAVWLDFTSIDAPGDQVIVSLLNGSQPQVYNVALDGISTKPIVGSSLRLEFRPSPKDATTTGCAATGKLPSLTVASVGYATAKPFKKISVCGTSELVNVACTKSIVQRQSDAVMRLLIAKDNKAFWCTGWLWGNKGHIITNYHCLSKQTHVDSTKFQFGVEMSSCSDKECTPSACVVRETLVGKGNVELVKANEEMDYAVLQITAASSAKSLVAKYGYLQLRDGKPISKESFYLVQHPGGRPKQIPAIVKTDTIGVPRVAKLVHSDASDNTSPIVAVKYMADTEGGSSGSPLISHKDKLVIGLHHLGGCPNSAVASSLLATELKSRFADIDGFGKV